MARRIDRLPDVVAVPITLASLAGVVAVLVVHDAMTPAQRSIVPLVVFGVQIVTAQVTTKADRRRYGDREQRRILRRALRTGVVPAVAHEERWRRSAHTWPDPDRVRGRARWTVATMAVTLVPVYGWVATDHAPQPTTLVLVVLTLLPLVWVPFSVLAVQSVEGANVVREHLQRS